MPDEMHQFPGILFIMTGTAAPGRHRAQPDAVLDNVEQLAVGHLLSRRKAHIRSRWIGSLSHLSVAGAIVGVTHRAVIGPMGAGLGENFGIVGYRIGAGPGVR